MEQPATAKQHKELRRLAERTGTSFSYPRTKAEATRGITRMRALKGQHRGVVRAERRDVSRSMAEPRSASDFRARETRGYGSSAEWSDVEGRGE